MNVLVTGASGFLGEAVARVLSVRGNRVVCMAHSSGARTLSDCEILRVDLRDVEALAAVLRGRRFDAVVDCAAEIPRLDTVHKDYFGNVLMTRNLLVAMAHTPPGKVVKLSTVDVYKIVNPITEQSEIALNNYYALSKRVSEQYVELWGREKGIATCIARLTQVFGPGDRSNKFIPSILQRVKDSLPVELFGDGAELRDYLYVEDAAALIAMICENNFKGIFNIATGRSRTLNSVISALQTIIGQNIPVEYRPRRKPNIDYIFDMARLNAAIQNYVFSDFTLALQTTYKQMQAKNAMH